MKKTAYTAFTSLSYRILNSICAILFLLIGFLSDVYLGSIGIVLVSVSMPLVLIFIDYFAFSGTSTRKQRTMNFIKSSFKGAELFRNALKTDLFLKEICLLSGFFGYVLGEIISFSDGQAFTDAMLVLLIYLPVSELAMRITLIISRRIALSMMVQTAVCYVCSMISTLLLILYSLLMPEHMSDYTIIIIILFIVFEIISIIVAVLLYKDCAKGYDTSFTDT